MGEDPGQERAPELAGDGEKSPQQLRAEIEEVREELGDTAAALAAKTDVKARAQHKVEEIKQTAISKAPGGGSPSGTSSGAGEALARLRSTARQNPVPTAALGALVGGYLLGRLSR
jgi:hypothetical protein